MTIAGNDIDSYEKFMDKQNPTNKLGEELTPDEKKKMSKLTKDCKGKIKQGLRKMKKIDYDAFLKEIVERFDDNC